MICNCGAEIKYKGGERWQKCGSCGVIVDMGQVDLEALNRSIAQKESLKGKIVNK